MGESMSLILKTTSQKFRQRIIQDIKSKYRSLYPKLKKEIRALIVEEFNIAYFSHPTVLSLQNGDLRAELGLEFSRVKVYSIYEILRNTLKVNISSDVPNSMLNVRIEMAPSEFQEVLRSEAAQQVWTDARGEVVKGEPLPWLEWLLESGDSLIADYHFSTKSVGRSSMEGIMLPGGSWRVPEQHSGTLQSNFLTEIFDKVREGVDKKLWRTVRRVLTRDS